MTKAVQFIKIILKCNMEIAVFAENLVSELNRATSGTKGVAN